MKRFVRITSQPAVRNNARLRPLALATLGTIAVLASGSAASAQPTKPRPATSPVAAVALSASSADTTPKTSAKVEKDEILAAMQAELDREKTELVLPGMQRPYFMSYRLEDIHTWDTTASYGALTSEVERRQRIVRVEVRIGDYISDSSSARGDGTLELAPGDDDPAALKFALWTATDDAYKAALRAYAAKQAALKNYQNAPTANDFTTAKGVTHLEPVRTLAIDREEWKKRIVDASGLYQTAPEVKSFAGQVQYSNANVHAIVVNRYTVDTDGAVLRTGYSSYSDQIAVGGQAPDGMELGRANGSTAATAAGLETAASLHKRTLDNLKSFNELRLAPVVDSEDYHGPVLFSGDAAADVFNRLFVPNVEADRPDMGTTARTQGAYQSSWKSPVLPPFLSVVDDPTLKTFEGKSLLGSYEVDDEGEPVAPVNVVERGKLLNYLLCREPVKDFPASNGHGRAALGQSAHSKAGVVIVKSSQPLTAEQMRAKLLALAKDQQRDVYEVETLVGDLVPRLLYRVSPEGKRTLVRGAVFDELDQRALRSEVVAAGGKPFVAQTISPVPETTIVPELLFADIAVKRSTQELAKLPYYAPPQE